MNKIIYNSINRIQLNRKKLNNIKRGFKKQKNVFQNFSVWTSSNIEFYDWSFIKKFFWKQVDLPIQEQFEVRLDGYKQMNAYRMDIYRLKLD